MTTEPTAGRAHDWRAGGARPERETLLRLAMHAARAMTDLTPCSQRDCESVVEAMNLVHIAPPLPSLEVKEITRCAINVRMRAAENVTDGSSNKRLVPGESRPHTPGIENLRLTIIKGFPAEYILHCPAWKKFNVTGNVRLSQEDFSTPSRVAPAIHSQIPQVHLESSPGAFALVWAGTPASKNGPEVKGLAHVLNCEAVAAGRVVEGATVGHESRELLRSLVAVLETAPPGENGKPDDSGDPAKMPDGSVWFLWSVVTQKIVTAHRLPKRSIDRLRQAVEAVIEGGLPCAQHQHAGVRRLYTKASVEAVERLRKAAYAGVEKGHDIEAPKVLAAQPAFPEGQSAGLFDTNDSDDVIASGGWDGPF